LILKKMNERITDS